MTEFEAPPRTVEPGGLGALIVPAWVDRIDEHVDEAWNRARGNEAVDRVVHGLTESANHGVLWIVVAFAELLPRPDRRRRILRVATTMSIESALLNGPLKWLVRRRRPTPHDSGWSLRTPITTSFPSGHASSAFCAATVLSDDSDVPTSIWFTVAGVVALTRVHVRLHWLSDTIAGALFGHLVGRAALRLWPIEPRSESPSGHDDARHGHGADE